MRAVFVNHCHPDMPHVCALRLRQFAHAMAARGHQIVLLTESLDGGESPLAPADLAAHLARHDWARPFYLPVKPLPDATLEKLRRGRMGRLRRMAVIGWRYLSEQSLYGDWQKAVVPYLQPLGAAFRPEVVWGSFGNTAVWNIARDVAGAAGCPWVADIKDNWRRFIPRGLRRKLASGYRDAAHMTAFSKAHALEAESWFDVAKTAVYSGFDAKDIGGAMGAMDDQTPDPAFQILITGSLYDAQDFRVFTGALKGWLESRKQENPAVPVRLVYAGNDHLQARQATRGLEAVCDLDIRPFLPLDKLLAAQRRADVNAYIRQPSSYHFHHKTIELLVAEKPILCFPEETEEALNIAREVGGVLYSCSNGADILNALSQAYEARARGPGAVSGNPALHAYSWQGQAEVLEAVLETARRRP